MNYLKHIQPRIDDWKSQGKDGARWMSVNNSSWHMKVFPEFHEFIDEIHDKLKHEEADPMTYSTTSVVWDLEADKAIYVWHELDELPQSTPRERTRYEAWLERKSEEYKAAEERRKAYERQEEQKRIERKLYEEFIQRQEEAYKYYVEDQIRKEEPILPFALYIKLKTTDNNTECLED